MEQGELIHAHQPCEDCGSSDALAIYTDHTYCFSCETHTNKETWETSDFTMSEPIVDLLPTEKASGVRGLFSETLKRFKVEQDLQGRLVFQHQNSYGKTVAQKVYVPPTADAKKRFEWKGSRWQKADPKNETNALPLYLQSFWTSGSFRGNESSIVITEGEFDALSVLQAFEKERPVVSLPDGSTNLKPLAAAAEWLSHFDEIVLMFDQDEAGQKAVRKAMEILPAEKVKVAKLTGFKDANEALMAQQAVAIRNAVWSAEIPVPDGLQNGSTLKEAALTPMQRGLSLPWPVLDDFMAGMRLNEFTTWCGGTGTGKSTLMRFLARHLVTVHKEPVAILMTEESNEMAAKYQVALECGVAIDVMHTVSAAQMESAYEKSLGTNLYWFDDHIDVENIDARISFLHHTCGVRYFILDHMSMMVVDDAEERKAIDRLMKKLKDLVVRLPIHVDVVCHLKKASGDVGHEEGRRVRLDDLRGSAGIKQMSFNVVGLERDQQGDANNIIIPRVLKQRYVPRQGEAGRLQYDADTGHVVQASLPDDGGEEW